MPDAHMEKEKDVDLDPKDPPRPNRWWQWVLLYPGLAIAILGSLPTYVELAKSYSLGVPFGKSSDAKEQNRLWQENFECPQRSPFTTIKNKHEVEIASVICESGDVLLRGKRPDWEHPQYRWVSWSDVAPANSVKTADIFRYTMIPTARAAERPPLRLAQYGGQIICQRWVGNGMLLQRVGTPQGCFDQIINTFNGWVVNRYPAPCNPQC